MKDEISFDELYKAYIDCRKKKKNKLDAKKFEEYELFNLQQLLEDINSHHYRIRPSECFIVKYPTKREVFCAHFRDRIIQHFVYNELSEYMDKKFIYDTANCRLNKGTDFAIKRVEGFVRSKITQGQQDVYFLKLDLSGFFMSINRQELLNKVLNFVDTEYYGNHKELLQYLIPKIILNDCTRNAQRVGPISDWDDLPKNKTLFNNPNGLPIGNICSQLFANFYLNELDHFLKSQHTSVSRYVDDVIIISSDKEKLKKTLLEAEVLLSKIGLKINTKKTRISECKYGIPYLGVIIYPTYTVLSRSRINRTYYAGKILTSDTAFISMASRWGMFKRYHGWNVLNRWYKSLDFNIKKDIYIHSERGIVSISNDDKKRCKRIIKI